MTGINPFLRKATWRRQSETTCDPDRFSPALFLDNQRSMPRLSLLDIVLLLALVALLLLAARQDFARLETSARQNAAADGSSRR